MCHRWFQAGNPGGDWALSPTIENLTLKDPGLMQQLKQRTQLETEQRQLTEIKKQLHKILSQQ
jgi:hypothetical protein